MVLAVLGLVILDLSFNRPFPHSCEQKHTVEAGGDKMQWFVFPPSQAWILFDGMCSLSKTATSLERTPYSCSLHFFSLIAAGLAHSLERRRLVVLFVILLISYFAGFTSTRCTESLAEKQEEGQKSQASKTTAQEKTC